MPRSRVYALLGNEAGFSSYDAAGRRQALSRAIRHAAAERDARVARRLILSDGLPKKIREAKQRQHVEGTAEWDQRVARLGDGQMPPSSVTVTIPETQRLVDRLHGRGEGHVRYHRDGTKQVTETLVMPDGSKIGVWRDDLSGRQSETDRFTVHYAKSGVHVVPSRPSWELSNGANN